jgi:hypothetical protein
MAARNLEMSSPTEFNSEFSEVLSQINGSKNTSAILRALELLRSGKQATAAEIENVVDAGLAEYDTMSAQIDLATSELKYLSEALDADLDQLIYSITAVIEDFATAYEALDHYDLSWFKCSPMSTSAKALIATALSKSVQAFKLTPATLWTNIIASDPTTLDDISYTGNYMSQDSTGINS